jgi:hypothetical protein
MAAKRGRAALLRQVQRGFTYAGFLFVFGGVGGFLLLFVIHPHIDRLTPILFLTALLEGVGMFAIAIALELLSFIVSRWSKGRAHAR